VSPTPVPGWAAALEAALPDMESGAPFKAVFERVLRELEDAQADRLMLLVRESRGAWAPLLESAGGRALFLGEPASGTPVALANLGFRVVVAARAPGRLAFARHRGRALCPAPPDVVIAGADAGLPFADRAFDLVVQEGGLPGGESGWGHDLGECRRVSRGEVLLVADNRLGYKRSAGRRGKYHVPSPLEFAARAAAPPRGERTLAGYRRAFAAAGMRPTRAYSLYPHSGEFVHVVAIDGDAPRLALGPKERENRLKMVGRSLGLFPVLTPSFALVGGGRGGPTRLDLILARLAELLDEPVPRADQLVATRGNTCVVLTAVPGRSEQDPAGRWCLHLPLSPSQRAQIERHHEVIARMPEAHPDVPVPEPLFRGELEGAFLACERRLGGFTAPHLPFDPETSAALLEDAGRHLARLVVRPACDLDEEGFERLVGRKLDLVAEHAHVASTAAELARLRARAREALVGEPLPEVLYHADLRGKHVQVDRGGRVLGFLDWGSAEDRGLPYFDLLHLVVHERKQEGGLTAAAAWNLARRESAGAGLRPREAAALDEYARALGLSEAYCRTVEALYPALVGAMAESNWDYSRPRWVHRQFGL